jgi:guanylate kinase
VVVNDDLERAIANVSSIIDAESVRHARLLDLAAQVGRLVVEMERQLDKYPQA